MIVDVIEEHWSHCVLTGFQHLSVNTEYQTATWCDTQANQKMFDVECILQAQDCGLDQSDFEVGESTQGDGTEYCACW